MKLEKVFFYLVDNDKAYRLTVIALMLIIAFGFFEAAVEARELLSVLDKVNCQKQPSYYNNFSR